MVHSGHAALRKGRGRHSGSLELNEHTCSCAGPGAPLHPPPAMLNCSLGRGRCGGGYELNVRTCSLWDLGASLHPPPVMLHCSESMEGMVLRKGPFGPCAGPGSGVTIIHSCCENGRAREESEPQHRVRVCSVCSCIHTRVPWV